jgi:abhydrolase domain-containing protein 17
MPKLLSKKYLIGDLSWKRLIRSIAFIYSFFALYVYFRADSMIFMPQPASYSDSSDILKLPITPTEIISALYLPNRKASHTLLYIHGNAEDLGDIRPQLEQFQRWGFSIFAYDYRGFGISNGQPSEQNAYQDAEVAYRYLTQTLNIPSNKIIVYGRSVGGGSATELATHHSVAGLILESTFTSAFRVVVPFSILPFDKFTNLDKLRSIHCPVLVIQGQSDQIIPPSHGHRLYAAASAPKQSLWVAGAGHDDVSAVAGDRHRQALSAFQTLVITHPY